MISLILQQWSYHSLILRRPYINGLAQERRNSIAEALELRLSCTNPSIYEIAHCYISYFTEMEKWLQRRCYCWKPWWFVTNGRLHHLQWWCHDDLLVFENNEIFGAKYDKDWVQCGAVITVNFPPKSSQQTLHSSFMRASYGVSFVGFKFWFIFCFSQSSVVWNTGLILGLRPANVRWRYISHWLGASLESALKYHVISDSIIMAFACTKLSSHFGQVTPCGIRVLGRHR